MLAEYLILLVFFLILSVIVLCLPVLSYFFAQQDPYPDKESAYECGFQPFDITYTPFDVRYYSVAILFLIFDLELVFITPWVLALPYLGFWGIASMYIFLFFLTLGFVYEWMSGGLE